MTSTGALVLHCKLIGGHLTISDEATAFRCATTAEISGLADEALRRPCSRRAQPESNRLSAVTRIHVADNAVIVQAERASVTILSGVRPRAEPTSCTFWLRQLLIMALKANPHGRSMFGRRSILLTKAVQN